MYDVRSHPFIKAARRDRMVAVASNSGSNSGKRKYQTTTTVFSVAAHPPHGPGPKSPNIMTVINLKGKAARNLRYVDHRRRYIILSRLDSEL